MAKKKGARILDAWATETMYHLQLFNRVIQVPIGYPGALRFTTYIHAPQVRCKFELDRNLTNRKEKVYVSTYMDVWGSQDRIIKLLEKMGATRDVCGDERNCQSLRKTIALRVGDGSLEQITRYFREEYLRT